MGTISEIKNIFNLSEVETSQIQKCIGFYSRSISFSNIIERIGDLILSIFGKSTWQVAKNALKDHASNVISTHFALEDNQVAITTSDLNRYALTLSEFILRYQTTHESWRARGYGEISKTQYLISESLFDNMLEVTISEIIARAPFGDGFTLPEEPAAPAAMIKSKLFSVYNAEYTAYQTLFVRMERWFSEMQEEEITDENEGIVSIISGQIADARSALEISNKKTQEDLSILDLTRLKSAHKHFANYAELAFTA